MYTGADMRKSNWSFAVNIKPKINDCGEIDVILQMIWIIFAIH
jgi:hypothetical protein